MRSKLLFVGICLVTAAGMGGSIARAHSVARVGMFVLGWDLDGLPEHPSIAQQIQAGQRQVEIIREDEPNLDSNTELRDYLNSLEARLLSTAEQKPQYPIAVHLSSAPPINAYALPGGQIIFNERVFDEATDESQLVAVLAHETAHELHNDFLTLWRDYWRSKRSQPVYEVSDSRKLESSADLDGAWLMYQAGWDPAGAVGWWKHFHLVVSLGHKPSPERIRDIEGLIAKLPAKTDLIRDSPQFEELKHKY